MTADMKMLAQHPVDAWAQGYEQGKEHAAAEIERLRAALREADKGLTAVIRQYAAHNHVTGEVIAGDEQYPWIRLALIGRDAIRALGKP